MAWNTLLEYILKIPIFVYSRHGTDKLYKVVFQEISKIGVYSHFTARGNVKIGINFSKIGIKIGIFAKIYEYKNTKIGIKIFQNPLFYSSNHHFQNTYFCFYIIPFAGYSVNKRQYAFFYFKLMYYNTLVNEIQL